MSGAPKHTSLALFTSICLKAGLHNGDYHSKLVHFKAQKIFAIFKKSLA